MPNATCSVEGCERAVGVRGWCRFHYQRWWRTGDVGPAEPLRDFTHPPICAIDGCEKATVKRGWCTNHYQQWRRFGDPTFRVRFAQSDCSVEGCDRAASSKFMCRMHYQRWLATGTPGEATPRKGLRLLCSIDGCEAIAEAKGLCRRHYGRNAWLWDHYRITLADYDEMLHRQGGCCATCGCPAPETSRRHLHVDHCHKTGRVRALLCADCNMTLGKVHDDPALLRRLAEYLEEHTART